MRACFYHLYITHPYVRPCQMFMVFGAFAWILCEFLNKEHTFCVQVSAVESSGRYEVHHGDKPDGLAGTL